MKISAPIYQLKRRAKTLVRAEKIPLHEALDRIAREEGFSTWSLLSSRLAIRSPASAVLSQLTDGDMLLIGSRPGHGKTLLGLELLMQAVRRDRKAILFTLEWTDQKAREAMLSLRDSGDNADESVEIVTSEEISAEFVIQKLAGFPKKTVAVIDYLQIMDQKRSKPILARQVDSLRAFAQRTGNIFGMLSQIDRSFDSDRRSIPNIGDVRLPNSIDPVAFSKTCFLHNGEIEFHKFA